MQAPPKIVPAAEWLAARQRLLAEEKEFTRLRDRLAARRREMPWTRVDKQYTFTGAAGARTLAQLFGPSSQLLVYHFMFAPEWEEGCKSCSFWADHFGGPAVHLAHRDVAFAAISRAPWAKLQAYARRLGWSFAWYSSQGSDFNYDYQVSYTPEQAGDGSAVYNYRPRQHDRSDLPGVSVFARDAQGTVFHTYSTFGRGIELLNGTYQALDLVPRGRDEEALSYPMEWVRRNDQYDKAG
jgi:predicted dithiol-disulfide oxidoreductase (DUF899 family)